MSNRREFNRVLRSMDKYTGGMKEERCKQVLGVANEILTDVKVSRPNKGVPRDTGSLANSGRATPAGKCKAEVTFGGAAAPYALVQHERTDYNHKLGEARYLIRGVERWSPGRARAELKKQSEWLQQRLGR